MYLFSAKGSHNPFVDEDRGGIDGERTQEAGAKTAVKSTQSITSVDAACDQEKRWSFHDWLWRGWIRMRIRMSHHLTSGKKINYTCPFSVCFFFVFWHLLLYIIGRDGHCPENKGTKTTGKKVSCTSAYLFGQWGYAITWTFETSGIPHTASLPAGRNSAWAPVKQG